MEYLRSRILVLEHFPTSCFKLNIMVLHLGRVYLDAPLICRSFEAQPANDTRAVEDKIDTKRDHDDEVEDVAEQSDQKRKQPWESALRLRQQLVLELVNLIFGNAKRSQKSNERLNPTLSRRAHKKLNKFRERSYLRIEGGSHDKQNHSQDTSYQEKGNGDCQRPCEAALEKLHKRIDEVGEQRGKQQDNDRRYDQ